MGEYGDHAAAKQAGFQRDDILISVDGRSHRMTESDLFAYLLNKKRAGDRVQITVLRSGEKVDLSLPMQ